MTDALNMHALAGVTNLAVACMQAGIDILLHPVDADPTVAELEAAVQSGSLPAGTVETAIARILKAKQGLAAKPVQQAGHPGAMAARLAGKSITLVDHMPGTLPLDDPETTRLVLCGDTTKHDISPISCSFPKHLSLDEATEGCDAPVIFAIFTSVAAWQGSSGLAPDDIRRIRAAIEKTRQSIVISFGSPYVLRHFGKADARIAAYDASRYAQGAVIGCLGGAFGFNGRLPVTIPKEPSDG